MNLLVLIIVVAVIASALAALKKMDAADKDKAAADAYYLRKSLFTPAERSFFGVLELLERDDVTIACKVRLADIFGTKKGFERSARQRALNRISAKHVDFLLIHKSDGRPLLGIELDDTSHDEADRVARDAFVDGVFSKAGLPILHVVAKSTYDPRQVRRQIEDALGKTG